jgi:hypothetical protein
VTRGQNDRRPRDRGTKLPGQSDQRQSDRGQSVRTPENCIVTKNSPKNVAIIKRKFKMNEKLSELEKLIGMDPLIKHDYVQGPPGKLPKYLTLRAHYTNITNEPLCCISSPSLLSFLFLSVFSFTQIGMCI